MTSGFLLIWLAVAIFFIVLMGILLKSYYEKIGVRLWLYKRFKEEFANGCTTRLEARKAVLKSISNSSWQANYLRNHYTTQHQPRPMTFLEEFSRTHFSSSGAPRKQLRMLWY